MILFALVTLSHFILWCDGFYTVSAFSIQHSRVPKSVTGTRDSFLPPTHHYHRHHTHTATISLKTHHYIQRTYTTRAQLSSDDTFNDSQNRKDATIDRFSKVKITLRKIYHTLSTLPPMIQLVLLLLMYVVHLKYLTQNELIFPFQLIPNDNGQFQSIGLDSLAGMFSFGAIFLLRKMQLMGSNGVNKPRKDNSNTSDKTPTFKSPSIPPLFSNMNNYDGTSPWHFPPEHESSVTRTTSVLALALLVTGYFYTGRFASTVELYLYSLAGMGFPLTIAMHRSLVVLGGHIAWVVVGSLILGSILRPQPFFGGGKNYIRDEDSKSKKSYETEEGRASSIVKQKYKWFTNRWNTNWLWWTIGGYFISSWFFNIADFINQLVLPVEVFELAGEGVVSQLINPENNDLVASLVGYLAPCISAPWWEEILYRGYLLPALCLQMKFWPAVLISGIIFSIHHVSTTGAIPLAILGWTWASLYAKSGNLLVTILIHAMWNSRVFLGSWLGL